MGYAYAIFNGEKNTFEDWGLMLSNVSIPLPSAQIITVPIPGGGLLDLSEVLTGRVNFNARTVTLTFDAMNSYDEWPELIAKISNYLHGKSKTLIFDNDVSFYYSGRFAVDTSKSDEATTTVVITGMVDPYKYDVEPSEILLSVVTSASFLVYGSRMPVVPIVTVSAIMTVTFGGVVYSLVVGANTIPGVCLVEGENTLLFTGTGNITISYRGGSF